MKADGLVIGCGPLQEQAWLLVRKLYSWEFLKELKAVHCQYSQQWGSKFFKKGSGSINSCQDGDTLLVGLLAQGQVVVAAYNSTGIVQMENTNSEGHSSNGR